MSDEQVKNSNSGFTFIELLAALVILALIVLPTMQVFVVATRTNSKARIELQATITANSVLESAKAFSIYNFDYQCRNYGTTGNISKFTLLAGDKDNAGVVELDGNTIKSVSNTGVFSSGNKLAYAISGIKQSSNRYDAVVVFEEQEFQEVNTYKKDEADKLVANSISEGTVSSALKGLYNKEYKITVYVYKHSKDGGTLAGKVLGSSKDKEFLNMISGSKFDTGTKPN